MVISCNLFVIDGQTAPVVQVKLPVLIIAVRKVYQCMRFISRNVVWKHQDIYREDFFHSVRGLWYNLGICVFQIPGKEDTMIYITGDTHGRFERIEDFCQRFQTSHDDILIILGDAGINFSGVRYEH